MSRDLRLTSTSYALLGLLAVQSWTTYELAKQMDRTLSRFWPRARSKVLEEPKKLVALSLATATEEAVGRRRRTVYSITAEGRRVLAAWVTEPGDGPVLEFEQLLKVFFSENGSRDDLLRNLRDVRAGAYERTLRNIDVARSVLDRRTPFPDRDAVNQLVGTFLMDFDDMVDRWAEWAIGVVETWPAEPGEAQPDLKAVEATLRTALDRTARYRAGTAVMASRTSSAGERPRST
jgi:PadR family transcriptional regulator, regulatory protein AphA